MWCNGLHTGFGSLRRRSNRTFSTYSRIAQLVEQGFCKAQVIGSRPFSGSHGQLGEWIATSLQNQPYQIVTGTVLKNKYITHSCTYLRGCVLKYGSVAQRQSTALKRQVSGFRYPPLPRECCRCLVQNLHKWVW